jgi:hypothetical protein
MTKLNKMWEAFAAYQPQASANGHGESWAKMCREKTVDANPADAYYAKVAANAACDDDAVYAAACAATAAAFASYDNGDADSDKWAQKAIKQINKAMKKNT